MATLAVVLLGGGGLVAAGGKAETGKPHLQMRASPRMAFPPVNVFLVAELKGGQAVEELYCPGLEWDWGDGTRSSEESDCPPFQDGMDLQRFFSAHHGYGAPGTFLVKLTMRRASRTVAEASVPVYVQGGPESASE
ncbi:MAG TPA: hypothetical protein VEQ10_17690 [Vicinamibacteria bacterium]|nr:hypothetical protein [Vicinamibacteria bacterium]